MKIKLKDGKEIELTEEVIQKVADLIIDSWDLEKPDYPYCSTLRDYFAGQALIGMITKAPYSYQTVDALEDVGKASYKYADAMLKERDK